MDYWVDIFNITLIFSIFSMSLNLLMGYAVQVSVAHAAFGAIGGYTAAYLSANLGAGFFEGLVFGSAAAGLIGLVVSLPALRLSPDYLILLTIAVSSIVLAIVSAVTELGGACGMIADKPADLGPWLGGQLLYPHQWIPVLLIVSGLVFLLCRRFGESPWGRVLRAIRDDDIAARALGRDVFAFKVAVLTSTAAMAGLAGVLLYYYNQLASPSVYGFNVSLEIFAMTVFGGLGNLYGSILGAAVLQLLQPLLEIAVRVDPGRAFYHSAYHLWLRPSCDDASPAARFDPGRFFAFPVYRRSLLLRRAYRKSGRRACLGHGNAAATTCAARRAFAGCPSPRSVEIIRWHRRLPRSQHGFDEGTHRGAGRPQRGGQDDRLQSADRRDTR
jgi:ABC-type branched-subunit amino acid transport system permease subunit